MIKHFFILMLTVCSAQIKAQHIKGFVFDLLANQPIPNAEIKNIRTSETTTSDRNGSFRILGEVNDFLAINVVGYQSDTIFYYDEAVRRIYLNKDENIITIDEILIKRLTDNSLTRELEKAQNAGKIVEVPRNQGGIKISPSRLFSKESKIARSNVELLIEEKNTRKIDQRFTKYLIRSLLPIDEEQIVLFREQYRPTIEFINNASDEDLKVYIIESYKTFKK